MTLPRIRLALLLAVLGWAGSIPAPQTTVGATPFVDIASSPFKADIEWLYQEGVTGGCTATRFCPDAGVTREQMASFLARLLELPATTRDFFDDDDGTPHEANINRAAAAGITAGCAPGRYCPRASVTREQMASFLARAIRLAPAGADYFLDDERSAHEGDINRAAAAGVTGGCGEYRFCRRATVTRGQMAAFLHRTRHPGTVPPALPESGPLPACTYEDQLTARTGYDQWQRTLLDTIYTLPRTYRPPDLVDTSSAGANGGHAIRALARADLAAMLSAARTAGHGLRVVSAYRSYDTQVVTFNENVAEDGLADALRRSARPGHSEHQLGTTIDFTHAGGTIPWNYRDWAAFPAGAWMRDNAWRYGWIMTYPKGTFATSCYDYEPWHYRYVGRDLAARIAGSGRVPRQVLWELQ